VNILDENIPGHQRQILRSQRIRVRQTGYDVGRKGMKDDEIIPWLLAQRNPTFFTRDLGFCERKLCHAHCCLVCLAVGRYEAGTFIRRLLRHPEFNTQAKRMGTVIRVSHARLKVWRLHAEQESVLSWSN